MTDAKADNFLEDLEHTHVVLFHEGGKETKNAEYNFIKNGLDKQEHCFYTTQNPQQILNEMKEFCIDIEGQREFLDIVEIPEKFENYS